MSKRKISIIVCLLCATSFLTQGSDKNIRIDQLFNFDWKFRAGEIHNAQDPDFDDSDWRTLDLPHDFQFEQPWNEKAAAARGFKDMGVGWYRKAFKADPAWKGRRVLLDFEGIMLLGDVWLNGTKIGSSDYGYIGFESEITPLLKYDSDNLVAVRASTGEQGGSRWYTGGGLYRDVRLLVKDSVSIARHGVFISTPTLSAQKAEVCVQVEVEGIRGKRYDLEIEATIFAPDGRLAGKTRASAPRNAKKWTTEVQLPLIDLPNPQRWSCETPHLYSAEVVLLLKGKPVDNVTERFGIRTLEYSNEFGFKLNGKKIFLQGIANHHDLGAIGAAAYEAAIARQIDALKAFGFNHIRTSHNPYSTSFLRLADEKGILVVDELIDKWSDKSYWPGRIPFTRLWDKLITEWVKRDRNHASVIMWSLGNELQMREDLAGFPTGDWGVTTYRIFDVLVKRYDPTRKTTVAMFPARAGAIGKNDPEFNVDILPPELATVTEIASFNYRYLNYQDYLKHAPHMIIYQSEATTNEWLAPFFGMDYDRMVGIAYWGAIEYWGESHGWPRKGWTYSFFNHALEPFPQAYLMKSAFVDKPLVHIGVVEGEKENIEWNDITVGHMELSSHWNRREGSKQNLFSFTNAEEVELLVNGKSLGIQKNTTTDIHRRNIIYWQNIPYGKGGNVVAIARTEGKEVARHQLETSGKATALKMELENADWMADGMDLQYVKVYAVDDKGRVVPLSEGDVAFDVSGEARIIAVDNGDHKSNDLFSGNRKKFHQGFVMAILRSNRTPGEVKIKATSDGLKKAESSIVTKWKQNK